MDTTTRELLKERVGAMRDHAHAAKSTQYKEDCFDSMKAALEHAEEIADAVLGLLAGYPDLEPEARVAERYDRGCRDCMHEEEQSSGENCRPCFDAIKDEGVFSKWTPKEPT